MDRSFSTTGGARIGWFSATFPFARLKAASDSLTLKVFLSGTYTFTPGQVVSLEKYGLIPYVGLGVRINHTVPRYPEKIVFWCAGNPEELIRRIRGTGFMPAPSESSRSWKHPGNPMRPGAIAAAIVLWNVLFLLDMKDFSRREFIPGPFSTLALLLVFFACVGVRRWPPIQRLILKDGREPEHVGHWLNLVTVISGIVSIIFIFILFKK